jgi:adenosylhomocysteine nucleosidase
LRAIGPVERTEHGRVGLWRSTSRPDPIVVFRTGIGREAAAATTREVLGVLPVQTVINTGCAGGLVRDLTAGSLVIARALLDDASSKLLADEACLCRLTAAARRAGISSNDGPLLTSRTVLASGAEKRLAREKFGALAVEMEGYAVAEVAREYGVRFGSARAILDSSELELPIGDGAGNVLQRALRTLGSPRRLPHLLTLANAVKAAQTSLRLLFRCFLDETPPN